MTTSNPDLMFPRTARELAARVAADRALAEQLAARHQRGYDLLIAHQKSDGAFESVTFKDEDEDEDGRAIGPVVVYADSYVQPAPLSTPYGAPDPEGMFWLGWHTRSMAQALARDLGVEFRNL